MVVIWLCLGMLLYIYFGYPVVLFLINQVVNKSVEKKEIIPEVSMVIAAYNEEKIIEEKIKNCFQLDYPDDKLEIIVANDGSTDDTAQLVKKYSEVKLLDYKQNEGKTELQNKAVKEAEGEIILFSDANGMYQQDAVKKLVRNFADPEVGAVCGELKYETNNGSGAGEGESLYWRYERFLKQRESNIHSLLGANGSIYAIRKELYSPLPADIISDFVEPLMVVKEGYRNVYDPEAISIEEPENDIKEECRRKVRIITRGLRGVVYIKDLLKPNFIGFSLFSHKILRWLSPLLLILLFVSNLIFNQGMYLYLLLGQVIFYLCAGLGLKWENKLFYIPTYFSVVNYAALKALIQFIKGEKYITWDTSDRD